ncbi:MAG: endonuclease [Clostridia bacterium]|nr:endonuclease [Clostridia bacterium]
MNLSPKELYDRLRAEYGTPAWWSEDPYEVLVQAILVQKTGWENVKKTTAKMGALPEPATIAAMPAETLEAHIRPCGFAKGKARAILGVTEWYAGFGYDAALVMERDTETLRKELLALRGIGAETADVMLVYAFRKPSFIIDAYTRRLMERLGYGFRTDAELRAFFEAGLPRDAAVYGTLHWLILDHGVAHCRKTPVCETCPLAAECAHA